jgi:RND family efflux transporter MFP subunit
MMRALDACRRPRGRGPLTAILSAAVVAAGLLTGACGQAPPQVLVATAGPAHITINAGGAGVLGAAVDVPVVLGFRGTVTTVKVVLGQPVRAGQPLVEVSSSGLDNMVGKLGARYHALLAAVGKLERRGASQSEIEAATSQATLAGNAYDVANATRGQVKAPIAGVVAGLTAVPGGQVTTDQPLLHIVDPAHLTVTAEMSTRFQGSIRVGQQAAVRSPTVGAPLTATVNAVSPTATAGGQTFKVVMALVGQPATAKPGMNAYVTVPLTVDAAVAVNHLAVLNADSNPTVFVVADGHARQRSVVTGLNDDSTTQIVAGLAPGDRVVIAGSQSLVDGAAVTLAGSGS